MTNKVFIPILVEDELPRGEVVCTDRFGNMLVGCYNEVYKCCESNNTILNYVTHWLKEVELPTEEEIISISKERNKWCDSEIGFLARKYTYRMQGFQHGAKYILNLLKAK